MRPKQFTLLSVESKPGAGLMLRCADGEQFELKPVPRTVALACLGWESAITNSGSSVFAA